ncbi:MAG: AraC family transcriptional regulator [Oscillospiraceae bacterium]|nr:AraC family transcriptional regulator [Oscillospiraceae bacterium]
MPAPIQLLFDLGLDDLNPIEVGESVNFPGRHVQPISFNAIIIHHVRRGHGTFYSRGKEYPVGPGQGFIILPGEESQVHYTSDHEDPWEYAWISFTGKLANRFSILPPVFTLPENAFPNLYGLKDATDALGYLVASDLFALYANLLEPQYQQQDFVRLIIEHIDKNYMDKLTVENFSDRFDLDRRYLSQQFKAKTGMSIRTYLTKVRLEKATELLAKGHSTRDACLMCGFGNTSNFHKMFTAHYGITPLQWKKNHTIR